MLYHDIIFNTKVTKDFTKEHEGQNHPLSSYYITNFMLCKGIASHR
jgi:hypothetical protein